MTELFRMVTFAVPLSGNKGSASMTLGLRDAFGKAGVPCHLSVFSYYPARDEEIAEGFDDVSIHPGHPKHIAFQLMPMIVLSWILPFVVPKKWKAHIRALREADVILAVGGTTFADSMVYKVPWNVLAALPGYMLRKPTVFLSQTIGPCEHWFNRFCAQWTLNRAKEVHGRGRMSSEWIQKLGIKQSTYRPDLSFSMEVPDFSQVVQEASIAKSLAAKLHETDRLPIGVAPNSIVFEKAKKAGRDYVTFLVDVVKTIDAEGCLPILIPHSYRQGVDPKRIHNNDRSLCEAVVAQLPKGLDCFYVDMDLNPGQLRSIIGQLHLLVASRFHSMISALSQRVPPVTFGWGHQKYSEVLEEFGVPELYSTYDQLDIERFKDRFNDARARRDELAETIRTSLVKVVRESDEIPEVIMKAIGQKAKVETRSEEPESAPTTETV